MPAKLYAMTCGRLVGRLKDMIEGEDGPVALPIPSYLIEHPRGRALFDTGMHPQCRTDAAGRLGERVARIFGFEQYGAQDDVKSRLESIDRDPGKVDFIVNSHLHFDHAGGNELVPNATMVVQRREWQAAQDPETAAKVGFFRADFDHGHHGEAGRGRARPVRRRQRGVHSDLRPHAGPSVAQGAHGDGRGRADRRRLLLLPHLARAPPAALRLRPRQMLASLDRLEGLERGGAKLFFGHDPDFWKDVPQAPAPAF